MDFTEKAWRVVALLALLILALSVEPASHAVQNLRDDWLKLQEFREVALERDAANTSEEEDAYESAAYVTVFVCEKCGSTLTNTERVATHKAETGHEIYRVVTKKVVTQEEAASGVDYNAK
mgnify:FL=1